MSHASGRTAWPWPLSPTPTLPAGPPPRLTILGTRGIPAAHGGFETFAERLALHLVGRGWAVTVACQSTAPAPAPAAWRGVRLVHHRPRLGGPLGTIENDVRAILRTLRDGTDLALTLGYNTALLGTLLRAAGVGHLMNMDGIEWRRAKWSGPVRGWFWLNERLAGLAAHHLIADHPAIADHLARHRRRDGLTVIPYGADPVEAADFAPVAARFDLRPGAYATLIARAEPENSCLEIVRAFSAAPRGRSLLVLGRYEPGHPYQAAVRAAASAEVMFPGAIYDAGLVSALRFHAALNLHGHRVGGTNPSLVEALAAGNPVIAHDNPFNRWVAGPEMAYFTDAAGCAEALGRLLPDQAALARMRMAARARHTALFGWPAVLAAYEVLLMEWLPTHRRTLETAG